MPILKRLRQFLDDNKVKYKVASHPAAFTAQEVAAAQHVPGQELAKVVMLRCGTEFIMVALPAPLRVDMECTKKALARQDLALATEQEFAGLFPQCEPGAMPPFGNLYNLRVWVDESLTKDEEIVFNAGNHKQTVRMKYADFARLVQPNVGTLTKR